jgi:cytochrome P450
MCRTSHPPVSRAGSLAGRRRWNQRRAATVQPAMTSEPSTSEYLFTEAFYRDPYPLYADLRGEHPVREVRLAAGESMWLISRYDDVRAAFSDPRFSKDYRYTLPPEARADAPSGQLPMMIMMDPPDHTRLRRLVSRAFTARRVATLRPRIAEIANALVDDLPAHGVVDLMERYAFPLPVQVICELLGVPNADRGEFGRWSKVMTDDSGHEETMQASASLANYLAELIEDKRTNPDGALLSALVEVSDDSGPGEDRLSTSELVGMGVLLLIAGHETTVNLIGNAMLGLLTHAEQRAALQANPWLLPQAVEEFLRWDSPVTNAPFRFTTEPVEIGGATIPAGQMVMLSLGAANRDEARFADAAELRLDREAGGHLAFGHGIHFCIGAPLARLEGEIAIGTLLARRPDLALAVDPVELTHRSSTLVRGLRTLPVDLG